MCLQYSWLENAEKLMRSLFLAPYMPRQLSVVVKTYQAFTNLHLTLSSNINIFVFNR